MTRSNAEGAKTAKPARKAPAKPAAKPSNGKVKIISPTEPPGNGAESDAPVVKSKLVRDSFTIPKSEYLVLGALKERASNLRRPTKKSELLRAGIAALHAMGDRAFLAALAKVPSLKTGRPKDTATASTSR